MILRRLRHRDDRGATLVEYALIVALVLVVCIVSIQVLEERAQDKADASEPRIGAPPDGQFYGGGGGGVTATAGGDTTGPGPSPTPQVQLIVATPPPSNDANKWIANATVTVTDGTNPLAGVVVTGIWTIEGGGGADKTATCSTNASGSCTVQRNDVNDNRTQVRFTVTTLTIDGVDTVLAPPQPFVIVDCTTVPGIC